MNFDSSNKNLLNLINILKSNKPVKPQLTKSDIIRYIKIYSYMHHRAPRLYDNTHPFRPSAVKKINCKWKELVREADIGYTTSGKIIYRYSKCAVCKKHKKMPKESNKISIQLCSKLCTHEYKNRLFYSICDEHLVYENENTIPPYLSNYKLFFL